MQIAVRKVVVCHPDAAQIAGLENRWARDAKWRRAASAAVAVRSHGVPGPCAPQNWHSELAASRPCAQELVDSKALNESQGAALSHSMSSLASIWQGPPGTGKTRTLVAFMKVGTLSATYHRVASARGVETVVDAGVPLV